MTFIPLSVYRGLLPGALAFLLFACGGQAQRAADESAAPELDPASLAGMLGKNCGEDIAKYCSRVLPGDGRVQSCLYAHQDMITDSCFEVTEQSSVMLERLFDEFNGFYNACAADLNTHCSDIDAGSGAQIACLAENVDDISLACQERVPSLVAAVAEDGE